MTGAELKAIAIKLYGEGEWKPSLAAALKVDEVTVWRYSKQAEVPFLVAEKMLNMAKIPEKYEKLVGKMK